MLFLILYIMIHFNCPHEKIPFLTFLGILTQTYFPQLNRMNLRGQAEIEGGGRNMKIKINQNLKDNEIGINEKVLPGVDRGFLEIGKWKREVIFKRLKTEDVEVPMGFCPDDIPKHISYKWLEKGNTLKLGPVIAYIVQSKKEGFNWNRRYRKYMKYYQSVNGLIFFTTHSRVDMENEVMRGYYYNHEKREIDPVERTFPFPDAIYQRYPSSKKKYSERLREMVNNRIFNTPNLNKLEQFQILRNSKGLLSNFPTTKRLKSIKSIDYMLKKFGTIYIKPINSREGKGIVTLRKVGKNKYKLTDIDAVKTLERKGMEAYIKNIMRKKKYILQQAAPMIQNKNIVLRSIMQKNEQNEWVFSGGYARIGCDGGIVTNRIFTKEFLTLDDCFSHYYHLGENERKRLINSMIQICKDVCVGYEKAGISFGDVAFDLIVGTDLKVWVIEVNNRSHNHRSTLLTLRDRHMYRRVISTPLLYAKFLSGF